MTVFGWDASDFDWSRGPMDLGAAARDGIQFFTHKATEGVAGRHAHYGAALTRARDAGIPVLGAYHVVRSLGALSNQVRAYLAYLDEATPWWRTHPHFFHQVDLERWPYDDVAASTGTAFADLLAAATGHTVVIYASKGQYGNGIPGGRPLWNAAYPSSSGGHYLALYRGDSGIGWQPYSNRTPVFWQYADNATIGSEPGCDANAFRGTLADLLALTGSPNSLVTSEDSMFVAQQTADQVPGSPYGKGTVFLCTGAVSYPLSLKQYGDLKTLVGEKLVVLTNDIGAPRSGWYPDVPFGKLPELPAVDVQALAAAVVAALPPAVDPAALVGPLADALAQHLPSHITLTGTVS